LRRQETILPVSAPLLSIRSLGEMQVIKGGRLISPGEWHSQVAQDLFYCLLAHPEGLTKDRIAAIFWPESPPKKVRSNFKNALYRLRLTLGSDIVVFEAGRYLFNTLIDYWYDAKEFLEILSSDHPGDEPQARVIRLQRAVSLYDGPYLPEVEGAWAAGERARLQQAFFTAALALGELQLMMGEFEALKKEVNN